MKPFAIKTRQYRKFNVSVFWSEEEELYVSQVTSMAISAYGETENEAFDEIKPLLDAVYNNFGEALK